MAKHLLSLCLDDGCARPANKHGHAGAFPRHSDSLCRRGIESFKEAWLLCLEVPDGREQLANLNFEGGSYLYEVQRS